MSPPDGAAECTAVQTGTVLKILQFVCELLSWLLKVKSVYFISDKNHAQGGMDLVRLFFGFTVTLPNGKSESAPRSFNFVCVP